MGAATLSLECGGYGPKIVGMVVGAAVGPLTIRPMPLD
jgi:hypothetical protein